MKKECETCIKRKTTFCPNSIECFETLDKPYYQNRMNLDERLQKDLSPDIYCLVHNKIVNLEQQCKKQKEVIDKITSNIQNDIDGFMTINEHGESSYILELLEIYLEILKEVSE